MLNISHQGHGLLLIRPSPSSGNSIDTLTLFRSPYWFITVLFLLVKRTTMIKRWPFRLRFNGFDDHLKKDSFYSGGERGNFHFWSDQTKILHTSKVRLSRHHNKMNVHKSVNGFDVGLVICLRTFHDIVVGDKTVVEEFEWHYPFFFRRSLITSIIESNTEPIHSYIRDSGNERKGICRRNLIPISEWTRTFLQITLF